MAYLGGVAGGLVYLEQQAGHVDGVDLSGGVGHDGVVGDAEGFDDLACAGGVVGAAEHVAVAGVVVEAAVYEVGGGVVGHVGGGQAVVGELGVVGACPGGDGEAVPVVVGAGAHDGVVVAVVHGGAAILGVSVGGEALDGPGSVECPHSLGVGGGAVGSGFRHYQGAVDCGYGGRLGAVGVARQQGRWGGQRVEGTHAGLIHAHDGGECGGLAEALHGRVVRLPEGVQCHRCRGRQGGSAQGDK